MHEYNTLLHWFEHWQTSKPDATYLTQPCPDGTVIDYSWREVGDQARRMAAHLQSLNLPGHSKVAILGKNTAHWIIADLAIWMAGHVSVPLYATASVETTAYVLEHAQARLLFVGPLEGGEQAWQALSHGIPADLPVISLPLSACQRGEQWDSVIARNAPSTHCVMPEPHGLATIFYTSGSTGRPKGVMHSFGTMCRVAQINAGAIYRGGHGPQAEERLLSYLPLAHTAERQGVESASLRYGMQVFFNHSLQTFSADLRRARPTMFLSVPRLWVKFYQSINAQISPQVQAEAFADPARATAMKRKILAALGLDQVHTALTGAAALPAPVIHWYRQLGLELLDGYGMSENFACAHFSRAGSVRVGYVGTCLPQVQCRIAQSGEILLKSPGQMLGYYRQPQLTRESYTADGFFKTGDRGEIDGQGRLRITGRLKELFKTSKGKYVAPMPIEARLGGHPSIAQVCVTGAGLAQPLALITLSEELRPAPESAQQLELETQLEGLLTQVNEQLEVQEHLACLIVVKDLWTVDNGLLTPTLKICRTPIEQRYAGRIEAWFASGCSVIFET